MMNKRIPIVIGVTGHRDLRTESIDELKYCVKKELIKLMNEHKNSYFVMLNSIASGADTLCANVALELGIKLVCPLPMEESDYKNDFKGDDLKEFNNLLKKADEVFVAPQFEEYKDCRDYLYRQAGIYVAKHSHVLLALWDGGSPVKDGCGTAETVSFMLDGIGKDDSYFDTNNGGAVIWIKTPRIKNKNEIIIETKLIENKKRFFKRNFKQNK